MNTRTLTSANAILSITVAGLFDVAQRLQGFSADNVFDTDATSPAQVMMGIDGRLSAGFVPVPVPMNIELQADSPSVDLFEDWLATEKQQREKLVAGGQAILPATQRRYTFFRGFLTSIPQTPSLGSTIKPRRFTITWERIDPSPYL